ncbi:thrombospondin [Micromonospora sp. NPDC005367]|uniref:thrombospondin n=1 Tax=Micromonospora sp. NPDC005367 TaxID=3155590 RepID=UPI00339E4795
MVRIPSLSRRPTRDENLDGGDASVATAPAPEGADRPDATAAVVTDRTSYRDGTAPAGAPGAGTRAATPSDGSAAATRGAVARAATVRPAGAELRPDPSPDRPGAGLDGDRTVRPERDRPVDADARRVEPDRPVVLGPKPRASLLATLGLVVGVAGALFVLTGTLAGYGIWLGAIGAVLSVLGLIATRRRHVAGKTDAMFGIALGLAAVVAGVLAMTGLFDWPSTDGDWVQRFREWLDSQFVNRF